MATFTFFPRCLHSSSNRQQPTVKAAKADSTGLLPSRQVTDVSQTHAVQVLFSTQILNLSDERCV